jgi:hypothetical protein
MIVALLALFVALGGTAVAAGIVPHAKFADKAGDSAKLQGKTAAQVAALAPAPAVSSVAGLVSIKTGTWSLNPGQEANFTVTCDAGKAIAGGWADPGDHGVGYQTFPTADGRGWTTLLFVGSSVTAPQSGTTYAVCLR